MWDSISYYLDPTNMLFFRTILIFILILITLLDSAFNLTYRFLFINVLNAIYDNEPKFRCFLCQNIERKIREPDSSIFRKIKYSLGVYPKINENDRKKLTNISSISKKYLNRSCCDPNKCSLHAELLEEIKPDPRIDTNTDMCMAKCPIYNGLTNENSHSQIHELNDMWNVIWRGCVVRGQQTSFFWVILIQLVLFFGSIKIPPTINDFEKFNTLIVLAQSLSYVICACLLIVSYSYTRPIPLYERKILRLVFLGTTMFVMMYFSNIIQMLHV